MYIITNNNNVIIAISSIYEKDIEHRNIKLDNYNIAYVPNEQFNVYEVNEIVEEIVQEKYCYTAEKGFYVNPNYIEPVRELTNTELQQEILDTQMALAELYESLSGGND